MREGIIYTIALFATGFMMSCDDSLEYSPNQVFDQDSKIGLNATNLQKLQEGPIDDTVTIAFVGDSQRFYDELDLFIDKVNTIPSVDFVLLAGDISDFGLLEEFELINDNLSKLNKPYIGVIGNHDVLAKGDEVFERMFGPLNFSFIYGDIKFVCHNTNGKDSYTGNVPDMKWLGQQLVKTDSFKYVIPVSHVPPFATDAFDPNLEHPYVSLFEETPYLLLSLHGHVHKHKDGYPYGDGVRYMTSHSFDQRSMVILKIVSGQVFKTLIDY